MTKYVIFCELWEKISVPDIKNLGLMQYLVAVIKQSHRGLCCITSNLDIGSENVAVCFAHSMPGEDARITHTLKIYTRKAHMTWAITKIYVV